MDCRSLEKKSNFSCTPCRRLFCRPVLCDRCVLISQLNIRINQANKNCLAKISIFEVAITIIRCYYIHTHKNDILFSHDSTYILRVNFKNLLSATKEKTTKTKTKALQ